MIAKEKRTEGGSTGNIRWTSVCFDGFALGFDTPAGFFPPLLAPADLRRPRVAGDAVAGLALDGPASASSFAAFALGAAIILLPRPVFGGMMSDSRA